MPLEYIRKRIVVFARLQRAYKNWFAIVLSSLFYRRPPKQVFLRNGTRIDVTNETVMFVRQLARLLENGWQVRDIDRNYLLLCSDFGICMKCRKSMGNDLAQLAAISVDKIYGQDFKDKVILDVGMYTADSAIYFANKGAKLVIGLEPYKDSYELALENIRLNRFTDKIKPLRVALAAKKTKAMLKVFSGGTEANSLTRTPTAFMQSPEFNKEVEVDTLSLEDLVDMFGLDTIDLLKMNCEGCEYDVLRNLSSVMFSRIREVVLGFHNGIQHLREILNRNGFEITRVVSGKTGMLGFLYAKKIGPFGNMRSHQTSPRIRHN